MRNYDWNYRTSWLQRMTWTISLCSCSICIQGHSRGKMKSRDDHCRTGLTLRLLRFLLPFNWHGDNFLLTFSWHRVFSYLLFNTDFFCYSSFVVFAFQFLPYLKYRISVYIKCLKRRTRKLNFLPFVLNLV